MHILARSLAAVAALGFLAAAGPDAVISNANACPVPRQVVHHTGNMCHVSARKQVVLPPPPSQTTVINYAPAPQAVAVLPPTPREPVIVSSDDPDELAAARLGCPLVHDATYIRAFRDGQTQYNWRGLAYWYMLPPQKKGARLCDHNGRLAWYYPPQPLDLAQDPPQVTGVGMPAAPAAASPAAGAPVSDGAYPKP